MRIFLTIVRKELLDTVRDRRTILVMVVFPLLLFPVLITVVTRIQSSQMEEAAAKTLRVALVTPGEAAGLARLLEESPEIRTVPGLSAADARANIERDSLDAVLVVEAGFDDSLGQLRAGRLTLMYRFSDQYDIARRRIAELVSEYEQSLLNERFSRLGLQRGITAAVAVNEVDITPVKEKFGKTVGGFIPYIFILFCFLGSMYPAIDLGAGEKERGTIETLLTAPVGRFQILLGKFAVVVLAGLLSAAVSVFGLFLAVRQSPKLPDELLDLLLEILDPGSVLLVLSLLLPLAVFFAGMLLTLSFFARSYKEAQSIVSPLSILIILPVAVGMIPGITLDTGTALIPVLNVSLATKEIISGTAVPGLLALVYASLSVLALLSLLLCVKLVNREETIFRGT